LDLGEDFQKYTKSCFLDRPADKDNRPWEEAVESNRIEKRKIHLGLYERVDKTLRYLLSPTKPAIIDGLPKKGRYEEASEKKGGEIRKRKHQPYYDSEPIL